MVGATSVIKRPAAKIPEMVEGPGEVIMDDGWYIIAWKVLKVQEGKLSESTEWVSPGTLLRRAGAG